MRVPTLHRSRLIGALAALAGLAGGGVAPSAALAVADPTTAQAIDANAQFLAWAPAPATPVKVCVVDTGVDLNTDVAANVVARYSMYGGTLDDTGGGGLEKHGTYVAGVIASRDGDGGSVGIWPQAQIVSVRVFPDRNSGSDVFTYLRALDTCRDVGAKVVNLSLSGLDQATGPQLAQLEDRITSLRTTRGIDVVAAAGNSGGAVGYPAAFPAVFAVGASDTSGALCSFSSRGPDLDVSALGCPVDISFKAGVLAQASGTSVSTPVVSGVLAALRAYAPSLDASHAEQLLLDTARQSAAGHRLDAAAAFRAAGLGELVGATDPRPRPATSAVPVTTAPATSAPTPIVNTFQGAYPDVLVQLGIRPPKLRGVSLRKGMLTVRVSGVTGGCRAIFTVDAQRFMRRGGTLKVRLKRAPKRIRVVIEAPGVGQTAPLGVRVPNAAEKRRARRD